MFCDDPGSRFCFSIPAHDGTSCGNRKVENLGVVSIPDFWFATETILLYYIWYNCCILRDLNKSHHNISSQLICNYLWFCVVFAKFSLKKRYHKKHLDIDKNRAFRNDNGAVKRTFTQMTKIPYMCQSSSIVLLQWCQLGQCVVSGAAPPTPGKSTPL